MSSIAFIVGPSGTWRPRAFSAVTGLGFDPRVFAGEGAALGSLEIHRPSLVVVLADLAARDILLFAGAIAEASFEARLLVVARVGWDGAVPRGLHDLGAKILSASASITDYVSLIENSSPVRARASGDPRVSLFDRSGRRDAELVRLEPDRAQVRTKEAPAAGTPVRIRLRSFEGLPEVRCLGEVTQNLAEGDQTLSLVRVAATNPNDAADLLRRKLDQRADPDGVDWVG